MKEVFKNIISSKKLTDKAKQWGGGGNNIDIIYLYGHGGTGKTYVAKQFAQETGAMFTSIKYPDIGSPFKDAGSMKINKFFENIIEKANSEKDKKFVVCIDEIDAVMKKVKDEAHGSEEASKARAALLTGIDRLRERCSNVTIIATSNYHPGNGVVDPIALRRFNNKIEVPLPDKTQTEALLEMYLKEQNIGAVKAGKFIGSPEFVNFADTLQKNGYSNGEIALIAEEAGKIFRSTLDGVADSELTKHPFTVDYLEKAMKINGQAASKTNELMNVYSNIPFEQFFQQPQKQTKKTTLLDKIKKLFHRENKN